MTAPAADPGWRIRPAAPADLAPLLALEQTAFPLDRLSRRSLRHLLTRAHAAFLVAAAGDGWPAGYAVVLFRRGATRARLYSLAVSHRLRHRGIARSLLDAAEQAVRAAGAEFLRLEVREDNQAAQALYESAGYRAFGRIADYYQDHAAALRLEKRIADTARAIAPPLQK